MLVTVDDGLSMVITEVARQTAPELSIGARGAVEALCAAARREGLHPEHLVIRLKGCLDDTDCSLWQLHPEHRDLAIQKVVSLTIEAYFISGGESPGERSFDERSPSAGE